LENTISFPETGRRLTGGLCGGEFQKSCLMQVGLKHFRMQPETLRVEPLPFSDDELKALQVQQVILAGKSL
jgi:hypothetical protein